MIRLFVLLFAMLFIRTINAQNLSPTVVNSSGGVISNSTHSLEWSLGELAVSTLANQNTLLTQGFLQPGTTTVETEDLFDESRLLIFPNPVSEWLNLQTDVQDIETVAVHDILGRLVLQTKFQPSIDLYLIERGTYMISLLGSQQQLLHSFKITKI